MLLLPHRTKGVQANMPRAISVSTFKRESGELSWGTPKIDFARDLSRDWERDNMVWIGANSKADSLIVNLDSVETSLMTRITLEDAIELRKQLSKAISDVRKNLR